MRWFKSKVEPTPGPLAVESVSKYRVGHREFTSSGAARDYAENHERRMSLAKEVARHLHRHGEFHEPLHSGQVFEIITYLETQTNIEES
jgi:hypothetical protein